MKHLAPALIATVFIFLWLTFGLYTAAGIVAGIAAMVVLVVAAALAHIWWSLKRAEIDAARYEALQKRFPVHTDGFGMTYERDLKKRTKENLTINQQTHHNGHHETPNEVEAAAWHTVMSRKQRVTKTPLLAAGDDQPKDFYSILQNRPHVMLIGGTGSGKSTAMCHAAEYRLSQYPGGRVVWLSTHAALDQGRGRVHPKSISFCDPEAIERALQDIFETYRQRTQADRRYRQLIVVLDEWPEIVSEIDGVGDVLRRLSRGGRKCAISLILGAHGATVGDLDQRGHSSVTRDFAQVFLTPELTRDNRAVWQPLDRKNSRVEITLPGPFSANGQAALMTIEARPTSEEQKVLDLYDAGMTATAICERLNGYRNGSYVKQITGVIERWR